MVRYKIGFSPKYEPYQMNDEYIVYFEMKPIGGLPCKNIVYKSPNIKDCMEKLKSIRADSKKKVGGKNASQI